MDWDIREQARKAQEAYNERPAWVKRISYFAGTNGEIMTTLHEESKRLKHDLSEVVKAFEDRHNVIIGTIWVEHYDDGQVKCDITYRMKHD